MSPTKLVVISAACDFLITAGGAILGGNVQAGGSIPSAGVWILALVAGAVAFGKEVKQKLPASSVEVGTKLLVLVSVLALGGCTGVVAGAITGDDDGGPFARLSGVVTADLDAAIAISTANGDQLAARCFQHLRSYVGTPTPSVDQIKGVLSAYAKARATRRTFDANRGISDGFKIACAPLLMDEREFAVRLGLLLAR